MRLPAISVGIVGTDKPQTVATPTAATTPQASQPLQAPQPTPAAGAGTAAVADTHALRELVDKLRQTIGTTGQQVQFSIDQDTHQTVLRVTDAESGALLRQIPGDEALSMARILDRMQGILIKQKA